MREITDSEFEGVISTGKVLVDFYATWCPPCKALAPVLDKLSHELKSVTIVKMNIDDNSGWASRLNVTNLPTLILFEDGEEKKRRMGAASEPTLRSWLGV